MPDAPPPEPEKTWELPLKWVVLTGVGLWAVGALMLLIYLFGPRAQP